MSYKTLSKLWGEQDDLITEAAMNPSQLPRPISVSSNETSTLLIEAVVEQHAEEAAFLWTARDRALHSPNYSLRDLSALDERVEAHLDGLRVAEEFGWQLCEQALDNEEPGTVFAAAVLAFDGGDTGRIHRVLEAACIAPQLERGFISALGWLPFSKVEGHIRELLGSERAEIRRIGIATSAAHRRDPGQPLIRALSDPNPRLRARALKACGEVGKTGLLPTILPSVSDSDDACRFFAAWSAARLGDRSSAVLSVLCEIAAGHTQYAERALGMALRIMDLHQAKTWHRQLRRDSTQLRTAAIAHGIIGDPEAVESLIDLMNIPAIARIAGEAFSMITGVNLSYEDLSADMPEGFEAGPTEDPEDENATMDPDEHLPWPVPALVTKWWNQHRAQFQTGRRYLKGEEITVRSLREVLISGKQRERTAAGLELALREPTQPLFEGRARGALQLEELKQWNS
jgi:uncharacterized protein (TIGR02270 family)